jgi:anti-sigma regulatory factor (Ser/Thr protein kinase)
LRTYLEVAGLPSAVHSARLHAKNTLLQWRMGALADTVELLVSEIVTNAIRASAGLVPRQRGNRRTARRLPVRFWLTSDRRQVMISVWDGDHHMPIPRNPSLEDESGRGLLLVHSLSTQWGCYTGNGQGGKIVWALCSK